MEQIQEKPKKNFKPSRVHYGPSKAEQIALQNTIRNLKDLNKNYKPWKPTSKDKIDPSQMIKIGQKTHEAKFKHDQPVIFKGMKLYVVEVIEPYKNEPHLKIEFQDHGYTLRELNGKKIVVTTSESNLKSVEEASQLGLLVKTA